jgi:hypothetical protein
MAQEPHEDHLIYHNFPASRLPPVVPSFDSSSGTDRTAKVFPTRRLTAEPVIDNTISAVQMGAGLRVSEVVSLKVNAQRTQFRVPTS